jgi:hypothetical protein
MLILNFFSENVIAMPRIIIGLITLFIVFSFVSAPVRADDKIVGADGNPPA